MTKFKYPTIDQVLLIHEQLVDSFGGSHGVRDIELLKSALERPLSSFMGEDLYPNIFLKAASLGHSIILNHPFLDGNKRTGISSIGLFLHLNGLELNVSQKELVETAIKIATKEIGIEEIASWLEKNSI